MMGLSNSAVRYTAKAVVMSYAHHIKERVRSADQDYLRLGVNDDFNIYASLFRTVIGKALGVEVKESRVFPASVVSECLKVVGHTISTSGFKDYINKGVASEGVYYVCLHVLDRVRADEFGDCLEMA